MLSTNSMIKLNDGNSMPQLGFGSWQVTDEEVEASVKKALEVGYRSIDSAQIYQNEAGLGNAISNSNVDRKDLFITTKVWNSEQGFDSTLKSFNVSMKKLKLDYLDLFLIHWPAPRQDRYVETWKALIQLKKEGRVKSIGVSNFTIEHLKRIIDATSVVPAVNQIELHPLFQQRELRSFHHEVGIKTESWSPLGQGKIINDPVISQIAAKYNKSPAQVIIRWHLQQELILIPKSITPVRIRENFDVFDFNLIESDMELINKMDSADGRIGPDPMKANF